MPLGDRHLNCGHQASAVLSEQRQELCVLPVGEQFGGRAPQIRGRSHGRLEREFVLRGRCRDRPRATKARRLSCRSARPGTVSVELWSPTPGGELPGARSPRSGRNHSRKASQSGHLVFRPYLRHIADQLPFHRPSLVEWRWAQWSAFLTACSRGAAAPGWTDSSAVPTGAVCPREPVESSVASLERLSPHEMALLWPERPGWPQSISAPMILTRASGRTFDPSWCG
jgi:hypothetical protein